MDEAFSPAAWHEFFLAAVEALSALTGLLFVALSLHLDGVLAHVVLRRQAVLTLVGLITAILVSGLALTPGQDVRTLGLTLIGLSVADGIFFLSGQYRRAHLGVSFNVARAIVGLVFVAGLAYTGISLLTGTGLGLRVLAALIGLVVAWSVLNCWALVTASGPRE